MPEVWDAATYDEPRRRLVPCFDEFYGCVAEMVARSCPAAAQVLDLGAGTGILSGTLAERLPAARFTLLDVSDAMLAVARHRLADRQAEFTVRLLTDELPAGPFDAVVSSLAIHHLSDDEKAELFRRAAAVLVPGGLLLNADQIAAPVADLDGLYRELHLDRARMLGSDEAELAAAVERMCVDRNSTLAGQLQWLTAAGLQRVDCFWRWYGFAVFGGWNPAD